MGVRFSNLHLILAHSKGQGRGHAYFRCDHLVNGDRYRMYYYCNQIESHVKTFDWHIYIRPCIILKGEVILRIN